MVTGHFTGIAGQSEATTIAASVPGQDCWAWIFGTKRLNTPQMRRQ
ncbi:hypothetical protein AA16373_2695 [Komagataeibacter swingsii DSM 16373]|nr:hypothetical protein AA16373_2695 [Komagataeibacter swingsii DSM 16373]